MAVYTINTRPTPQAKAPTKASAPRSAGTRNTVFASIVGVLLIGGVAFGAYKMWPKRVPAPDGDPVQVARFVGSDDFNDLSSERQMEYMRSMRDKFREIGDKLTDEEKGRAWSNAMEARERPQLEKYFSLPTPERQKYLDELIDKDQQESAKRRAEWEARAATRPAGTGRNRSATASNNNAQQNNDPNRQRGRGFTGQRMKDRVENKSPGQRAQSAEFRAAMMARMNERGIQGFGGGRRGPR